MSRITKLHGRPILDSCGHQTLEIELSTDIGVFRASVPAGYTRSPHECVELRDNDPKLFNQRSI